MLTLLPDWGEIWLKLTPDRKSSRSMYLQSKENTIYAHLQPNTIRNSATLKSNPEWIKTLERHAEGCQAIDDDHRLLFQWLPLSFAREQSSFFIFSYYSVQKWEAIVYLIKLMRWLPIVDYLFQVLKLALFKNWE